jgi:membrane protein DedA with SNARE-associated domain
MIDLAGWIGPWTYVAILLAAALEGEIVFVAASALVAAGELHPLGVVAAGACGATLGDQVWFHVLRGRPTAWLLRVAERSPHAQALRAHVRRHQDVMILAIRFLPGLRIAVTAACALAGVSARRFAALNGVAALVWAVAVLTSVAWLGPGVGRLLGLRGWSGILAAAVTVAAGLRWAGRAWLSRSARGTNTLESPRRS